MRPIGRIDNEEVRFYQQARSSDQEADGHLHPVAIGQALLGIAQLYIEVIDVDARRHTDLFDLHHTLIFLGFLFPLKTHTGAKKRFNLTKTGKVKRAHAFKRHLLNGHGKDTKRNRF